MKSYTCMYTIMTFFSSFSFSRCEVLLLSYGVLPHEPTGVVELRWCKFNICVRNKSLICGSLLLPLRLQYMTDAK